MPPEESQLNTPTSTNKRALIIGVDAYPKAKGPHKAISDLAGCVNDARLVRSTLVDKFNVPEENIRFLSSPPPEGRPEDEATRAGIVGGFEELIEKSEPGDMVVVYFAGHGSRVLDRDLDESSGKDSTLVPSDAVRWSSKDEFATDEVLDITDDEVHVKLLRLAKKGIDNITLIFDSCHSGTMSRGPSDPHMTARQAPEDDRPSEKLAPIPYTQEELELLGESRKNASGWTSAGGKYVMISGCRDTESSFETEVPGRGDDGEVVKHGALTYFLVQALREAQPGDTYRDIFERVAPQVSGNNSAQHPQIDGAQDRLIFGTDEIEPLSFIRVFDVQDQKVTLEGGAAHGLTVGSRWAVYPQGTKKGSEDLRLGELEVTEVRSTKSFAVIVEGSESEPGAVRPDLWAVETAHDYGDRRMKVQLVGSPSTDPEIWSALEDGLSKNDARLQVVGEAERAIRIVLVPARTEVPDGDPAPQLGPTAGPMVAVLAESGDLMMTPKEANPEGVRQILKNLDLWAQYRYKLAIENPGSALAKKVAIEVLRRVEATSEGRARWEPLQPEEGDSLPALTTGDFIKLRLTNKGPRVYFGLVDFLINGKVEVAASDWLEAGTEDRPQVVEMPAGDEGAEIVWEGGFPFDPNPYVESPAEGTEVLKLFLTTQETDFSALANEAATRGAVNPLEVLLSDSSGKHRNTRGVKLTKVDDWGTVSFPFTLRAPTEASITAEEVSIGGGLDPVTVSGQGITGQVRVGGTVASAGIQRPPTFDEDSPAAKLRALLQEQGLYSKQSLTFGDTQAESAGTRGGSGGAPTLTLKTQASDPDWGELVMSTDDAGLVRWHFPVADSATRGSTAGGRSAPDRIYRISPPTVDESSPAPGTRGPIGATLGKLFVDRLAVPLLSPVVSEGLGMWESVVRPNRVRWFGPNDIGAGKGREVKGDDWKALGEGRALLFLHGPFSRAHKSFRDLTPDYLGQLEGTYGQRIFALDHKTVSEDPMETVEWFMNQLPAEVRLDLDVVAHSRGGLIGRVLAERGQGSVMEGRDIRVGRLVLVGSPSGGTALADASHVETMLSVFTNLLSMFDPTEVAGPILQLAQRLAVTGVGDLPGIQAMVPGGAFLQGLPAPNNGRTEYFGIASDVSSPDSDKFTRRVLDRLVKNVLGDGPNDLFVSESSVWGGSTGLTFADRHTLSGAEAKSHLKYFEVPSVQRQIAGWLGRDNAPITVTTPTPDASPPPRAKPTDPEAGREELPDAEPMHEVPIHEEPQREEPMAEAQMEEEHMLEGPERQESATDAPESGAISERGGLRLPPAPPGSLARTNPRRRQDPPRLPGQR